MAGDLEGKVVLSEEGCRIFGAKLHRIKITDKTRETCKLDGCYGKRASLVAHARSAAKREYDMVRPRTFCEEYLPTFTKLFRYVFGR